MPTYIFKTSINCNSCLSKVKPALDARAEITSWQIDLENSDKILTVETETLKASDVIEMVDNVGFEIEPFDA